MVLEKDVLVLFDRGKIGLSIGSRIVACTDSEVDDDPMTGCGCWIETCYSSAANRILPAAGEVAFPSWPVLASNIQGIRYACQLSKRTSINRD